MTKLFACIALAGLCVSCSRPQATASSSASPDASTRPHANLAQLMRGVPFTFANIVFDAQSEDPAAARTASDSGGATAMFRSVYGGWQEVENSALALAESAALMVVPGRTCENGKPVPVSDEKYRQAAQSLVEAGLAAYKAAQSKDMDAMVDVSDTVATACANCHEPYRDFDNPDDRCTPMAARSTAE